MREDQPFSPDENGPLTPPPPTAPAVPPAYTIHGSPSDALVNALYNGYTVRNGQFVYGGQPSGVNGLGGGSITNPQIAADYLNKLWSPLSTGDYQGFWNATGITGGTAAPSTLKSYAPMLTAAGFKLNPNAAGDFTDFTLPNGQIIDPLKEGGAGGWQWLAAQMGGNNDQLGPLLQPFGEPAPHQSPFEPFRPTTGADVFADPSYDFRFNQGMRALTNSASARGLLRGGPTLKDFVRYGQDFASTDFGNIDQRRYRDWSGNLNAQNTNWQHAFDTWGKDFDIYKWNKTWPYDVLSDQQRIGLGAAQA